jgi:predicted component of type VI protein secretion system
MKLSLDVVTPGKWHGKTISISCFPFVIGRDPKCHLRPASPQVSNRHCALALKGDKIVVQDFGSTNGTFVNGRRVEGEVELQHKDHLQAGPVAFLVRFEVAAPAPVDAPAPAAAPTPAPLAPVPAAAKGPPTEDEEAAAMLLALKDDSPAPPPDLDKEGVPTGDTVLQLPAAVDADTVPNEPLKPGDNPSRPAKPAPSGDTSSSAKAILEKYWRRPRT